MRKRHRIPSRRYVARVALGVRKVTGRVPGLGMAQGPLLACSDGTAGLLVEVQGHATGGAEPPGESGFRCRHSLPRWVMSDFAAGGCSWHGVPVLAGRRESLR